MELYILAFKSQVQAEKIGCHVVSYVIDWLCPDFLVPGHYLAKQNISWQLLVSNIMGLVDTNKYRLVVQMFLHYQINITAT